MSQINVKRVYEDPEPSDGLRILVDRLWPRGIAKEKANIDHWMKEVAPSTELRKWFGHAPERFEGFKERYVAELAEEAVQPYLRQLLAWSREEGITLLYAKKEKLYNHALILKQYLEGMEAGNR